MKEYLINNPGIIIGSALILLGLAAGLWPQSISLYHYLSAERRKNVDMKGLGRHTMIGLILLGAIIAGLDVLIQTDEVQFILRIVVAIIGTFLLLYTSQRYDHNA